MEKHAMHDRARVNAFVRQLIEEIKHGEDPAAPADWLPAFLFALALLAMALWLGWVH
jgi:hypothetical protein